MKIRCCAHYVLMPNRQVMLDLAGLMQGRVSMQQEQGWQVMAAHLDQPYPVDAEQMQLLAQVGNQHWQVLADFPARLQPLLQQLINVGLLLTLPMHNIAACQADQRVRDGYWHGLSAVYARHARWHNADVVEAMDTPGLANARGLRQRLGPSPPSTIDAGDMGRAVPLPAIAQGALAGLLQRRVTCRNFCIEQPLTQGDLGQVIGLAFAAHGQVHVDQDMDFLKRSSPSAGGLHALETYLLVQRVHGLAPGWYHYRPLDHAITPLDGGASSPEDQALTLLAGQHWFASAPVIVVLAARYQRVFWKYREHAKAWRALLLEAGHFSQTLYLAATEAGLGAFVTCAVNEPVAESALQIDPMQMGVLAVCGIGSRGQQMETAELDPAGAIWQPAGE